MLERMKDVLRNRKEGDKGFSLVELAVVIVIIGILVAIAVPIFANMQTSAQENSLKAAAANGASIVAVNIASGGTPGENVASAGGEGITVALESGNTLDNYCVTATGFDKVAKSGSAAGCSGISAAPSGND